MYNERLMRIGYVAYTEWFAETVSANFCVGISFTNFGATHLYTRDEQVRKNTSLYLKLA